MTQEISKEYMRVLIANALREDLGARGDVTSALLMDKSATGRYAMVAREPLVVSGLQVAQQVFAQIEGAGDVEASVMVSAGEQVNSGAVLMQLHGNIRKILSGERVVLNIAQRMCAIATKTRAYVEAVAGTRAIILDTRKTTPGLRILEKAAVVDGGGQNHRMGLYDAIFIKDNHIAAVGDVVDAVMRAKAGNTDTLPIIVECDTLDQVKQVLPLGVDRVLLDNMAPDVMAEAVALCDGAVELEASGGITLDTVRAVAESGVDYISVGALTHSVRAMDIGLDAV